MLKILIILLGLAFIISSCKKEELAPTTVLNEMPDSVSVIEYKGDFVPGSYGQVTGQAGVNSKDGAYEVMLSNFTVNNGPALHVYLSKEAMPVNFIDLGALKSINGNQVYAVTGKPDFMEYKYVSIHCVAFNHLFAYALLKK